MKIDTLDPSRGVARRRGDGAIQPARRVAARLSGTVGGCFGGRAAPGRRLRSPETRARNEALRAKLRPGTQRPVHPVRASRAGLHFGTRLHAPESAVHHPDATTHGASAAARGTVEGSRPRAARETEPGTAAGAVCRCDLDASGRGDVRGCRQNRLAPAPIRPGRLRKPCRRTRAFPQQAQQWPASRSNDDGPDWCRVWIRDSGLAQGSTGAIVSCLAARSRAAGPAPARAHRQWKNRIRFGAGKPAPGRARRTRTGPPPVKTSRSTFSDEVNRHGND